MKAAPVFEAGNHRWWVLYDQEERRVIDSNVYIVESNGQSAILDPGGFEIFPQVLAAVAEVVPPTSVGKAFVSHQDPDIASSLPLWNACNGKVQWHIPSLWEGFIRHYGALDAELICTPDEGGEMIVGGHKLEIIPAHYLHASANFHVYDPEAKVLFSGDVGTALLPPGHSIWVGGHQGADSPGISMSTFSMPSSFTGDGCLPPAPKRTGSTVSASWISIICVRSTGRFTQART